MPSSLLARVENTVLMHGMLERGDHVVIACSGGPDSLALLGLLCELRDKWDLCLTAVYVDHGLRPEAPAEGRFVCRIAADWGVQALVCRVKESLHVTGASVQEKAREARYRLLEQTASAVGARVIATGHTADDQAETVTMRMVRGTGIQGLVGIPPVNGAVIRPLLAVYRNETVAYCQQTGITPVQDPSNASDDYLRNRVRHHLMPVLAEYNPQLTAALGRLAETARADNEWLEHLTAEALSTAATFTDGGLWCPKAAMRAWPLALQRRALRFMARRARPNGTEESQELDYLHVDRLLDMVLRGRTGANIPLPGRVEGWVEREGFWIGPQKRTIAFEQRLLLPGRTRVPSTDLFVDGNLLAGGEDLLGEVQSPRASTALPWDPVGSTVYLDWWSVRGAATMRTRLPGDAFQPLGMRNDKKLQDIFVDEGIPRRWRDRLPVVCDEQGIIWVAGLRIADRVKVSSDTRQILQFGLSEEPDDESARS